MARNAEAMKIAKKMLGKPAGPFVKMDKSQSRAWPDWMTRAYKNNHFIVMIDDNCPMNDGTTAVRVMVQRHDDAVFPDHWATLQRIKNTLFGAEVTAIEYFPPQSELSNAANIYWFFIMPGMPLPVLTNRRKAGAA